jgi:hypothetical protein
MMPWSCSVITEASSSSMRLSSRIAFIMDVAVYMPLIHNQSSKQGVALKGNLTSCLFHEKHTSPSTVSSIRGNGK